MKAFQLLLSTAGALLHGVSGTPTPPSLSYLGTVNASLAAPVPVGVGPLGARTIFGITGGIFKGPVFSGTYVHPTWDDIDAQADINQQPPSPTPAAIGVSVTLRPTPSTSMQGTCCARPTAPTSTSRPTARSRTVPRPFSTRASSSRQDTPATTGSTRSSRRASPPLGLASSTSSLTCGSLSRLFPTRGRGGRQKFK